MAMASSAQIAAGALSGGEAVGSFINQERTAGAIVAQSDFDRKMADLQAQDAIQRGNQAARRAEVATTGEVGRARARMAAGGVSISSGSALDVQVQDATFGELDAQTIRNNAMREALGYKTQAGLSALAARARAQAIEGQAVDTLATGAARTYGMFRKPKVPGLTNTSKPKVPGLTNTSKPKVQGLTNTSGSSWMAVTSAAPGGDPSGGDYGSWSP
jgi:hypothetical protein